VPRALATRAQEQEPSTKVGGWLGPYLPSCGIVRGGVPRQGGSADRFLFAVGLDGADASDRDALLALEFPLWVYGTASRCREITSGDPPRFRETPKPGDVVCFPLARDKLAVPGSARRRPSPGDRVQHCGRASSSSTIVRQPLKPDGVGEA